MFKKRPFFLKNQDWYYQTELNGKTTFHLTKLGMAVPEVLKSYLEYYHIPKEKVFEYATDFNLETEFLMWFSNKIREKMASNGATEAEIKEMEDIIANIDEITAKENHEE